MGLISRAPPHFGSAQYGSSCFRREQVNPSATVHVRAATRPRSRHRRRPPNHRAPNDVQPLHRAFARVPLEIRLIGRAARLFIAPRCLLAP